MLGVHALLPAAGVATLHPLARGERQRCLRDDRADGREPRRAQRRRVGHDAGVCQRAFRRIRGEHLARVHPQRVERPLHTRMRIFGAVAQPDHPVRRFAPRGRPLPSRSSRRFRRRVRRSTWSARAAAAGATGRSRIAAPWWPRNRHSASRRAAGCGRRRRRGGTRAGPRCGLAPTSARLDFTRIGQPQPPLPEQVEADIGQRDVLLQHRAVAHPFAEPLRQHDIGIAQTQQILEKGCVNERRRAFRRRELPSLRGQRSGPIFAGRKRGGRHMCFTSSGIGKNVGCR